MQNFTSLTPPQQYIDAVYQLVLIGMGFPLVPFIPIYLAAFEGPSVMKGTGIADKIAGIIGKT